MGGLVWLVKSGWSSLGGLVRWSRMGGLVWWSSMGGLVRWSSQVV